jgi:hypothetical protein
MAAREFDAVDEFRHPTSALPSRRHLATLPPRPVPPPRHTAHMIHICFFAYHCHSAHAAPTFPSFPGTAKERDCPPPSSISIGDSDEGHPHHSSDFTASLRDRSSRSCPPRALLAAVPSMEYNAPHSKAGKAVRARKAL